MDRFSRHHQRVLDAGGWSGAVAKFTAEGKTEFPGRASSGVLANLLTGVVDAGVADLAVTGGNAGRTVPPVAVGKFANGSTVPRAKIR